jgi:hypothetical protein
MKTIAELEPSDCRYPMNDGGPYLFCGEPTCFIPPIKGRELRRSPYCREHRALCTEVTRTKVRA